MVPATKAGATMSLIARSLPQSEPNVTPMLDVLLVLLIIFMAATIQVHRTVDVHLPQPCVGVCAGGGQIVLEVLPGPSYRINQAAVPAERLHGRLIAIYENRPEKTLHVAGYRGARYEDVLTAMGIARAAGVRVIGIAPKESFVGK
jgi:biopolymer transport protein TolR